MDRQQCRRRKREIEGVLLRRDTGTSISVDTRFQYQGVKVARFEEVRGFVGCGAVDMDPQRHIIRDPLTTACRFE